MPNQSDREALRNQVIEALALQTAETFGQLALPPRTTLDRYRELSAPTADAILRRYEVELSSDAISENVVASLGRELRATNRIARIIEIGFDISLFIEAALIGVSHLILDLNKNASELRIVYYILLFIVAAQLLVNGYLKFFKK